MQTLMNHFLSRFSFLLFVFCLSAAAASATHNRAGEITYTQIGPNTIRMTITTYTKTSGQSGQADRGELDVDWGDGTGETVPRSNFVQIYPDIRRNEYVAVHTYPGASIPNRPYIISMQDPNRNENILNINNGNSVNVEFYLQTEVYLFASSSAGNNSSPILLEPPVDFGVVGQVFQHTPNGYDPEGDSIAYELIMPFSDRGTPVPGFVPVSVIAPGPNNNFTFDVNTGLFTWNAPQRAGEYNIAILVKSYRNGQYLGGIVRDIQIDIRNAQNTPPIIEVPAEICVQAGELIDFDVVARDLDLPSQIVTLTGTGGPFLQPTSPATFSTAQGNPVTSNFRWQTNCSHVQAQPYQLVFKARDTYFINGGSTDASLATFSVVQIQVVAPPPQNVQAQITGGRVTLTWDAPYICENAPGFFGFTVWRKDVCDPFEPDSCEVGLAGRGYVRINPTLVRTPTGNQYVFIDNNVTQGALYSYRVLGEFATPVYNNGNVVNYQSPVSSVPSDELCVRMARDLPLMTNVDINTTLTTNAEIFVQWSKPDAIELDTVQNPPPYRYELFRSSDLAGANFLVAPIFVSPTYATFGAANDTSFTDIGAVINTEDNPYCYRVAFYSGGDTLGFTSIASSIRLSVAATDGRNDLTWAFNVPWRNYEYVVYLETPTNSGVFTVLDTVDVKEYAHTGLTNGETYCYYVKGIGTYGIPTVLDPLYNKSQRACATPLDTLPPCPISSITAIVGCDNVDNDITMAQLFNTISWRRADDSCAADAAFYRVYFSPYCDGNYTMVAQSSGVNDTFLLHQPDTNNLAGCYYVTVVDSLQGNGGNNESSRSAVVRTENCPIYRLPNTFTPNGDGQNEVFRPFLPYRYIKSVNFVVVNRWGETVFATEDPYIGWDGKDQRNGKPLAEGTYFYTCVVYQNTLDAVEPIKLSGYVELLRGGE
jgi:gliding motility-associated-like protein